MLLGSLIFSELGTGCSPQAISFVAGPVGSAGSWGPGGGPAFRGFHRPGKESFGAHPQIRRKTLVLKDSLIRVLFDDVPDGLTYTGDWMFEFNGIQGADISRFSIRDYTNGTVPFTIAAGAPNHSLYVRDDGNLGVGTSTPAVRLDVKANSSGAAAGRVQNSSATGNSGFEYLDNAGNVDLFFGVDNAASTTRLNSANNNPIVILTNSTERLR